MTIQKPSNQEEEYFARMEFERRQKEAEARRGEEIEEIRRRIATLGAMLCPRCGAELVPVHYREVEIDKCSRCEGIWLAASSPVCSGSSAENLPNFFSLAAPGGFRLLPAP